MRWRCWGAVGAALLAAAGTAAAADVHAVMGTIYESNLFESVDAPRGGWANRLYVSASGYPLRRPGGYLHVRHQGGIKRLWTSARGSEEDPGDVVVNHLDVTGRLRAGGRVVVSGSGTLKVKNANRVPGEEAYLRGGLEAGATAALWRGISASGHYRRGGDDSRDAALPEVSLHEAGVGAGYGRSRRFRVRLGLIWRRLDYNRPALAPDPASGVRLLRELQSDRLREFSVRTQIYRGALVHLEYGLLDNTSNSFGYGFRAHRFQAMVTRHLVHGVDGQVYVNVQLRRYDDPLTPLPGTGSEADEYERTVVILKLSRQMTDRYGVSLRYGFSRNGARRSGAFYRKHTYTVSLDTAL